MLRLTSMRSAALLLLLVVAGCGGSQPEASDNRPAAPSTEPTPLAGSPATTAPTAAPPDRTLRQVEVFFGTDEMLCQGVRSVARDVAAAAPLRPALEQLFEGPTMEEQAGGLSAVGAPGLLRGVRVVDDRVYVDLSSERFPGTATTSCGGAAFNANLNATVRGIVPDAQVIVALDGDPRRFVEAQQGFCPSPPTLGDRCDASGF